MNFSYQILCILFSIKYIGAYCYPQYHKKYIKKKNLPIIKLIKKNRMKKKIVNCL